MECGLLHSRSLPCLCAHTHTLPLCTLTCPASVYTHMPCLCAHSHALPLSTLPCAASVHTHMSFLCPHSHALPLCTLTCPSFVHTPMHCLCVYSYTLPLCTLTFHHFLSFEVCFLPTLTNSTYLKKQNVSFLTLSHTPHKFWIKCGKTIETRKTLVGKYGYL